MKRWIGLALLTVTLGSTLGGCIVYDQRRCRGAWMAEYRDHRGRWHRGRCR